MQVLKLGLAVNYTSYSYRLNSTAYTAKKNHFLNKHFIISYAEIHLSWICWILDLELKF